MMSIGEILLQQVVNGLALGMMYALLALGFTMVYGIIELINFAHFSVFMVGTFLGLTVLHLIGFTGSSRVAHRPAAGRHAAPGLPGHDGADGRPRGPDRADLPPPGAWRLRDGAR